MSYQVTDVRANSGDSGFLRRGGSKEEAIDAFKALFYGEDVRAFYPEEAMRLNTGLMVDLFARELLEKPVL